MLSPEEKQELLLLVKSSSLKADMKEIKKRKNNFFLHDDQVDLDAYISFLSAYNEFINHEPKPFKPIICKDMRL
jgi:hypothetical protein